MIHSKMKTSTCILAFSIHANPVTTTTITSSCSQSLPFCIGRSSFLLHPRPEPWSSHHSSKERLVHTHGHPSSSTSPSPSISTWTMHKRARAPDDPPESGEYDLPADFYNYDLYGDGSTAVRPPSTLDVNSDDVLDRSKDRFTRSRNLNIPISAWNLDAKNPRNTKFTARNRTGDDDLPISEKKLMNILNDTDVELFHIGSSEKLRSEVTEKLNHATKILKALHKMLPPAKPQPKPTNIKATNSKTAKRGGESTVHADPLAKIYDDKPRKVHTTPARNGARASQLAERRLLPAHSAATKILSALESNPVILVTGETGCGKTTQVPQFILDPQMYIRDYVHPPGKPYPNVVCTQPRRISAITVAERVAGERGESIGDTVGWQIRFEKKYCPDTRLLFCTTGIILRKLQTDPSLRDVTHLIIDEVHERSLESDFLLILVKDLIKRRPDIRVILMSATLKAESFQKYFDNCPKMHIEGRTFPVTAFFLEDILQKQLIKRDTLESIFQDKEGRKKRVSKNNRPEWNKEMEKRAAYRKKINLMAHDLNSRRKADNLVSDEIARHCMLFEQDEDFHCYGVLIDLIPPMCRGLGAKEEKGAPKGSILIFVPGWKDIMVVHSCLMEIAGEERIMVLPLHGEMDTEKQRRIFEPAPPGLRKIVISTNIAETSVTINDVVCVIDFGIHKENTYDSENNLVIFKPTYISQANVVQRRGRAGRVRPGVCFHMFSSAKFNQMRQFQKPEILRMPLENMILQVAALGYFPIEDFLARALKPPDASAIDHAIQLLQRMGAMQPNSQQLTALGRMLAMLPINPQIGKVMVLGLLFGCKDPMLSIAAFSSIGKSPFSISGGESSRKQIEKVQLEMSRGHKSDHILRARLFSQYKDFKAQRREQAFAKETLISLAAFRNVAIMSAQFAELLEESGIVDLVLMDEGENRHVQAFGKEAWMNRNSENHELLNLLLCGGLFPNCVRVDKIKNGDEHRFVTQTGEASLFPFSVGKLYEKGQIGRHWGVYLEKRKNINKIELLDFTPVPPLALILFSDRFHYDRETSGKYAMIHVDRNIRFKAYKEDEWAVHTVVQLRWCLKEWVSWAITSDSLSLKHRQAVHHAGELLVKVMERLMGDSAEIEGVNQ